MDLNTDHNYAVIFYTVLFSYRTMAESSGEMFKLRVILPEGDIERVSLPGRPDSVPQLNALLREHLKIPYTVVIQFKDPDFGDQLCNVSRIDELENLSTVTLAKVNHCDLISVSSSLESSESGDISDSHTRQRQRGWPKRFVVPNFTHDIEFALRDANEDFDLHGKRLTLKKEQKHKILKGMAGAIYEHKAYPKSTEISNAAKALVEKHPSLEETGSINGWDGWRDSLVFKMGNFRRKLSRSGCPEVRVNSGKRCRESPGSDPPHKNIKRPRRAEVNYLPQFPQGESEQTLEMLRVVMEEEFDGIGDHVAMPLINSSVSKTFALRRKEVVTLNPTVTHCHDRWPALFLEEQVRIPF